jgi:hypothetical protein
LLHEEKGSWFALPRETSSLRQFGSPL